MGKTNLVLVEINERGDAVRIFRNSKAAAIASVTWSPVPYIVEWPEALALQNIRRQIYERTRDEHGLGHCEDCHRTLAFEAGHRHERLARGKRDENGNYGEISVANCAFICPDCHVGPEGAHGDRKWGGRTKRTAAK